jgi:hypothetical protein
MPPGSGGKPNRHHPDEHQPGHQPVSEAPAAKARRVERSRRGCKHAEAVAPLGGGGAGSLLLGPQQLDPVGVDDDVVARRQKRDDDRGESGRAGIGFRVGKAERENRERERRLDSQCPAAAPSQACSQMGIGNRSIAGDHRNFRL